MSNSCDLRPTSSNSTYLCLCLAQPAMVVLAGLFSLCTVHSLYQEVCADSVGIFLI